jgi:hypothetical protein
VTTRQSEEAPYTARSIQEMLGLSRGVLAGLVASGFVTPRRGPGNTLRFTFRDVVLLRTAVELQAARIAPRKILGALRKLKASLPAESAADRPAHHRGRQRRHRARRRLAVAGRDRASW